MSGDMAMLCPSGTAVAIIGMVGRFPGARNINEFWQNLCAGKESITFFGDEELQATGVDPTWPTHPRYVKAGALLDGIDQFDAQFFGFTPHEAEMMDPQRRLLLECAWEALEHAGYNPDTCMEPLHVYASTSPSQYAVLTPSAQREPLEAAGGPQMAVGNDRSTAPLLFKLNLGGSSAAVQMVCSTSLAAVHLACQSLLSGKCDLALAGGISMRLPQIAGYLYEAGGSLSPDGHCRAFDAKANGCCFGSGVGMVVLKRLEEAIASGDAVQAVIRGSAIGKNRASTARSSIEDQAKVIQAAQACAQVEPETVEYVEADGTGTAWGDWAEVAALTQVFRRRTDKRRYCAIGSVKTNVGHLGAAAGIAGLIKTVLILKHKQIPPSLHYEEPNPKIDFDHSPFYVNTTLCDWKAGRGPRRAGVSSFDPAATNVHLIVEQAPPAAAPGESRACQLLIVSARTETALETASHNLADCLQHQPELCLPDVAYTLQVGRKSFAHRRVVVCQDLPTAQRRLTGKEERGVWTHHVDGQRPNVAFVFPGQGAQYVGMAEPLYREASCFHAEIDRCALALLPDLGLDLRQLLYPPLNQAECAGTRLTQTQLAQPALFMVEYALAQQWIAWGIRPQAMLGHSLGEYVAATVAGVFSLPQALHLVALRGRLMQQLPGGGMLAVAAPLEQLAPLLGPDLAIAAHNAPRQCVVSGPLPAVGEFKEQLKRVGIVCQPLRTSHAFHSRMMEPMLERFRAALTQVDMHSPQIPFISNLSGGWMVAEQVTTPDYWLRHLREMVRFSEGIGELLKDERRVFLEVGPATGLPGWVRQQAQPGSTQTVLESLQKSNAERGEWELLISSLGRLWLSGCEIDWDQFHGHAQRRLPLPTYPFEREPYPIG